jgi:hypothetical protein
MRPFIIAIFALFGLVTQANAVTIQIDLMQPGGVAGTGGSYIYAGPCYCGFFEAFFSPVYQFPSGTTIDFGQLWVYPRDWGQSTPDAGPFQSFLIAGGTAFPNFSSIDQFPIAKSEPQDVAAPYSYLDLCPNNNIACIQAASATTLFDLTYTIPAGANSIQVIWVTTFSDPPPVSYLYLPPAVPEPSAWAMLLIGFAGIGAMTYRRRKSVMLAARLIDASPPRRH